MTRAQIIGTGSYAPEKVMTNADMAKLVDTTDEWIVDRTGIKERRVAAEGEVTSDMAVKAAVRALEMANTRADELDMIIVGTISPDMPMPACAAFVAHKLGAKKAFAFDVSAACAGSLFGMSIASQYIQTGAVKRALVIGVELLTRIIDWEDRNTCVLFGDAAGAMVLGPSADPNRGILSTHLHTEGALTDILCIKGGGSKYPMNAEALKQKLHKVSMNGREVFKFAVRSLTDAVNEALVHNQITADEVTHLIAHQANLRIIDAVIGRLKIAREKAWLNIEKYGNTSSASLPTTLDEANRAGRLKPNDTIAMMAIGAGMSWGSALVRW
ncbi:MAG: 3-oxoacyl-[acyl-carrier-protein] synthase [Myxococcaceae bacterium]|nr:3-oxoacyl-[acyl-carrier-protein] synthase [Myxococcaceae bacterium]